MGTEAHKSVVEIDLQDIQGTGLSVSEAGVFLRQLREVTERVDESLPGIWQKISTSLLRPELPFPLHQLMYYSTYKRWNVQKLGPEPVWFPSMELARNSNLGRLMEAHGKKLLGSSYRNPLESFSAFQKWSALHPEGYVQLALEQMNVYFHEQPRSFLDKTDDNIPGGVWLPGAVLNAAECCLAPNLKLGKTDDSPAIVWKDEGADDLPAKILSLAELRARVNRVANALVALGFQRGDTIGIDMPMTIYAVIVYLAIVLAGMVVVSIADSFVGAEIATRCRVSQAKAMFTQDHILRGGKRLPLYSRVVEADAPRAIVIPADGDSLAVQLRDGDLSYEHFVLYANKVSRPEEFKAVAVRGEEFCNILFSSGTTGDPKAIPWTHISPLRCGVDGFGHQDIRVGDIVAWPTNLGWMMGPFLIYASLLNGAAIALYNGSPLGRGYGRFIQVRTLSLSLQHYPFVWWDANTKERDRLEAVQLKAFRGLMSTSSRTARVGVRSELGVEPLEDRRDVAKLKWRRQLETMDSHRYPKEVMGKTWTQRRPVKQAKSWTKKVQEIVQASKLPAGPELWEQDEKAFVDTITKAVGKCSQQTSMEEAMKMSDLSLLTVYPEKAELKNYLRGTPCLGTRLKFKFRMGAIPLNHKKSRMGTQLNSCAVCDDRDETSSHYLVSCAKFTTHRARAYADIAKLVAPELFNTFSRLDSLPKAAALVSNVYWRSQSGKVDGVVKSFLVDTWKLRTNTLFG